MYPRMAESKISERWGLVICILFYVNKICWSYEENCDYLDTSRKDRTSYLRCQNYGCCGDFKNRHCCVGPVPIIAGVFGGVLFILVVGVILGICYTKYKKQNRRIQPVPTITAELYNDIPLPSPPAYAPPVYNPARLHPPTLVTHPFRQTRSSEEHHPPPSELHPPRIKPLRK